MRLIRPKLKQLLPAWRPGAALALPNHHYVAVADYENSRITELCSIAGDRRERELFSKVRAQICTRKD